ncbi:MAG: glutamyl-tRNA reductase [Deltaproteobacteria bacterium]|nr:glutamyl-tRNA reductase [Deltaproteobacteria bacterium]
MGEVLAVGMSHRTAPVAVRERFAFDETASRRFLRRLVDERVCREAMLVSTCNRVELYVVPWEGRQGVERYLHAFRVPSGEHLDGYLYWHQGRDAVRHLFRVACSLDSLVVGEPQILGQLKEAVRRAEGTGTLGRTLTRLAHQSLAVAKRVRTRTDIGRYRVGVGNAGVDLATQIFGSLKGRRALLVGTGKMGRQVARALLSAGLDELVVASRSHGRAVEVAEAHGGTPIGYDRVGSYLSRVDVVITATDGMTAVLSRKELRSAVRARFYRPMFLVDLAVPRNIDPGVDQIEEVFLFNIDDLSRIVMQGQEAREVAAVAAEEMVEQEAGKFLGILAEVDIGPQIGALTHKMETLRQEELDRSRKLLSSLDEKQIEALELMTRALVKKVLHAPILSIREAARDGNADRLGTLLGSWGIDEE